MGEIAAARRARAACACMAPAATFAWLASAGAAAPPEADPRPAHAQCFYFDEARALTLDPTRVAVLPVARGGEPVRATLDLLRGAGVEPTAVEAWPIAPWTLVTLPEGGAARALLTELADLAPGVFVAPVFLDDFGGPMWPTPDLLVGVAPGLTDAAAEALLLEGAAGAIAHIDHAYAGTPGLRRVRLTTNDGYAALDAANALARRTGVLYAEPDMVFTGRPGLFPNDDFFNEQWGFNNFGQSGGLIDFDIDAVEAWDITTGDASVIIGIIDTGVDAAHADLNLVAGTDVTNNPQPGGAPGNSFDNHGTAVAGCATAISDNFLGVAGVAPLCRSASIRTFISTSAAGSWTTQTSWTVNGLEWARLNGVRVTCNSNGYGFTSSTIASKYASTRAGGMVHFAAALNDGVPAVAYPASLPSVNAVGAADRFGARSSFSNYGVGLAFLAPGTYIPTTDRTGAPGYVAGDYAAVNGTSFAAPISAGVAGLLLAVDPLLTPDEVEDALFSTCVDMGVPGYETDQGWGMLNARAAVEMVLPPDDCLGDLNGDNVVNTADLGGLVGSFGTAGPFGDVNGDGVVNTADLGTLIGMFGPCPE